MNNTTPAVIAATRVVSKLAASEEGLAQSALAGALGITTSTCYRILRSLEAAGWATKNARGLWSLGSGLLPVAAALRGQERRIEACRALLDRIARERGLSCKLSLRRGVEQVVVVRAEKASPVKAAGHEGDTFPIAEGSSGAALLADLTDSEARAAFSSCGKTQTSLKFLLSSLASLREKGWCVRPKIQDWPIAAISAPVRDADGAVIAALTFVLPASAAGDKATINHLLNAARECGIATTNAARQHFHPQ